MLQDFFDMIRLAIRELLADLTITMMNSLVDNLNDKVNDIGTEVAKGPQAWNSGVFNIIRGLSDNVILPVASLVITYVLVYELYHMVVDQNNMKEFHIADLVKYLLKACISVMILANSFSIVMAIFDVGSYLVNQAIGEIGGSAAINLGSYNYLYPTLVAMEEYELLIIVLQVGLIHVLIFILSIVIMVILYGRMIEIYLYLSVVPIPFAAFGNKELSGISQNYVKGLFAVAFQGFFIIVCIGIYAALVSGINSGSDIQETLFQVAASTLVLLFVLLKSGSISKSIFNAH